MKPLISVVIPVFNEESRITRALGSLQHQTYQNLEIIVVDDHSTDDTASIVQSIAAQDSRVTYHLNPKRPSQRTNWRGYDINAGFAARNHGFDLARGEWITTQDADDATLLNRIEVQHSFAERLKATVITIQWMQLTSARLGKCLDVGRIERETDASALLVSPEEIVMRAKKNQGILMREPFHRFIPFPIKWFPYTRKLFYRRRDIYPGADNSMLFHRSVLDAGYRFRPRNQRTWGAPDGRGSGRDFAYLIAHTFKNSWSLKLPMYLWDVKAENEAYDGYDRYLV